MLAAGAALIFAQPSQAADPPVADNAAQLNRGLNALRNYNLIVTGDLPSTSSVQGRTFVGGDLKGGSATTSATFNTQPGGQVGGVALKVVGNVSGNTKTVENGGAAQVGGNAAKMNLTGGGTLEVDGKGENINAGSGLVFIDGNAKNINAGHLYVGGSTSGYINATVHRGDHSVDGLQAELAAEGELLGADLLALSDYFATLTPTHSVSYSANGQSAIFDAGTGSGVAVFSLANITQTLKNRSTLEFVMPSGYDAVIVNVAGSNITLPNGINFANGSSGLGTQVIWNFYEASNVNFAGKAFYGSVLAPEANGKFSNLIEGSAVFGGLTQNGQVRQGAFAGDLSIPGVSVLPLAGAVPEPGTWAMMILGFGAIGATIRRRRLTA